MHGIVRWITFFHWRLDEVMLLRTFAHCMHAAISLLLTNKEKLGIFDSDTGLVGAGGLKICVLRCVPTYLISGLLTDTYYREEHLDCIKPIQ